MRKLKLPMYVSLDGVVENPAWTVPFWNDELSELQADYTYASDALVLGRVTYEGFAASWPSMEEVVHPVLVGTGKRLFAEVAEKTLRLSQATTIAAGVAVLTYTRASDLS